jgi:Clp amino terminal domain, pathogenicity island component
MDTTPPPRLDELITYVRNQHPDGDALAHLSDAVLASEHLGEVADHLVGHFVDQARKAGASWTEIGRSMGVTKQAAQKRFVPRKPTGDLLRGGLWERFTDRAQQVVLQAREEARTAGNAAIGTEHVVLAMTTEPESLAAKAIEAQGVSLDTVRGAAADALGPARDTVPGHVPFTSHAKKMRDLALREALRLGHNYVGTEHMLLALLRDRKSPGAKILTGLGISRDAAESWIVAAIDELRRGRDAG